MTPIQDQPLYDALLNRYSVRRYRRDALPASVLACIRNLPEQVESLVPQNRLQLHTPDQMQVDRAMVRSFGAYGVFVNPPHAMLPTITGTQHPLVDWGYRAQQIMIGINRMGVGSCYIGAVSRQDAVRARLDLAPDERFGALLIFGTPARSVDSPLDQRKRLPFPDIFFQDTFEQPAHPPQRLVTVMEAARAAPSAVNTQPWRFLWREPWLHVLVRRHNPRYLSRGNQAYRYVDGGVVMANISMALKALGAKGAWRLDATPSPNTPELEHLASIQLQA